MTNQISHFKAKETLRFSNGQWRPCRKRANDDKRIQEKLVDLEILYDRLEGMPEPKRQRPQKIQKKGAEVRYRWAMQNNTAIRDEEEEERERNQRNGKCWPSLRVGPTSTIKSG